MKLDKQGIMRLLPHRDPFLFVDEVIAYTPGESASAIWNITGNERFFEGHYPDYKVLPGVLIIEAMAQTCGIAVMSLDKYYGRLPVLGGVDKARWRNQVKPGDKLLMEADVTQLFSRGARAHCKAFVHSKMACSCDMLFIINNQAGD